MIRAALALPALAGLLTCAGDETLSGYGATDAVWVLQELDNAPFTAHATLIFPEEGALKGDAPCNTYTGAQTAPYPWFAAENITSTRRACPDLTAETTYFTAIAEMTLAEVSGDTLILSNDAGRMMVFAAQ